MKRFIALTLLLSTLLLAACRGGEPTEAGFIDPKTDIEYVEVTPMGLYPLDPQEEFITVTQKGEETVYYSVYFEDASRFLCYEIEGYYFLMRASNVKEPNVREFEPIAASIYSGNNTAYVMSFYADKEYLPEDKQDEETVGDSAICKQVADAIMDGEAIELPASYKELENFYSFRLLSQKYPGLYYLVSFFSYNGRYFLRDDAMGKTVYCPREIIIRIVGKE
jgi:hypothetical protein